MGSLECEVTSVIHIQIIDVVLYDNLLQYSLEQLEFVFLVQLFGFDFRDTAHSPNRCNLPTYYYGDTVPILIRAHVIHIDNF